MTDTDGRLYGGVAASERREQRRVALIDAGLELFGTDGYPNISVKRICDEAGLTQRYFYESFTDRADLLAGVYNHCVTVARDAVFAGAGDMLGDLVDEGGTIPPEQMPEFARHTLRAFIESLAADPRRARVMLIEVVGVNPAIEKLRLGAILDWAELILGFVATREPTAHDRLAAIGLVGAITQLLVFWQTAQRDPVTNDRGAEFFEVDGIHQAITEVFIATYDRIFADQ